MFNLNIFFGPNSSFAELFLLSFLSPWNGENFKTMKCPTKRETWFLVLFIPPDLQLLLIKKQTQTPRALLLLQPHTNSVSSIALVPLPQTHALGDAQHFL